MLHALTPRLPALLLGSDSPTVPDAHIQAMLATTADVTLAPTEDGGYWAIAAHRTHPEMFAGVRWSTADTLTDTEAACRAVGLSTARGPAWFDIDEPADLIKITEFLEHNRVSIHPPFMSLTVGSNAPDLNLTDENGQPFKLSALQGKTVVLYFYPKADTPGCTLESCEFRDNTADFAAKNAVIIGISPDVANDQLKFKSKYDLPFSLLADFDHAGAEAYGVWNEKIRDGKTFMGISRTTFIIGPDGKIAKIFEKVQPAGHATEVLAAL
jgi:peroxiredoxin Q/BCP